MTGANGGANVPGDVLALALENVAIGAGMRVALFGLIGLLLLLLGFLIGYAVLVRRRPPPPAPTVRRVVPSTPPPVPAAARRATPAATPGPAAGAASAEAVSVSAVPQGPMACPSCRREYEAGVRFCPHDARKLMPAAEIMERSRASGSVCPRCRRAFDAGVRFCPHDAEELVPLSLWEATQGKKHQAVPTGVLAKLCPQCNARYDLVSTFCAKDGAELVTIN
jgi:hypothetical protein